MPSKDVSYEPGIVTGRGMLDGNWSRAPALRQHWVHEYTEGITGSSEVHSAMMSWSWLTAERIVIPDCVRSDPVSDDTLEGDKSGQ